MTTKQDKPRRVLVGAVRRWVQASYARRHQVEPRHTAGPWTEVETDDAWVEMRHPDDARWTIAARFGWQAGALGITEVRIVPTEEAGRERQAGQWAADVLGTKAPFPAGGVTATLLRRLRPGELRRAGWQTFHRIAQEDADFFPRGLFAKVKGEVPDDLLGRLSAKTRRAGRRQRLDDLTLARVAAAHVQACAQSHRPAVEVGQRFGWKPDRVRDLIRHARRRGLLTPATTTKVGGELTPQALALLDATRRPRARQGTHRPKKSPQRRR